MGIKTRFLSPYIRSSPRNQDIGRIPIILQTDLYGTNEFLVVNDFGSSTVRWPYRCGVDGGLGEADGGIGGTTNS